jgi:hypothetical protein
MTIANLTRDGAVFALHGRLALQYGERLVSRFRAPSNHFMNEDTKTHHVGGVLQNGRVQSVLDHQRFTVCSQPVSFCTPPDHS